MYGQCGQGLSGNSLATISVPLADARGSVTHSETVRERLEILFHDELLEPGLPEVQREAGALAWFGEHCYGASLLAHQFAHDG